MAQEVVLMAKFVAKNGCEDDMKNELMKLVEPTRKEKGCMLYNFHVETENPKSFVFYEIWENNDVFTQHAQTDHFVTAINNTKEMLEKPLEVIFLNKQ